MLPPAFLTALRRTALSCVAVLVLSTVTSLAVPAPQARDVLAADRADASLGLAVGDWSWEDTQDVPEEKKLPVFISSSANAHGSVQEDRPINLHDAPRNEKMPPRGKTGKLYQVGGAVPSHAELTPSQEKIQLKEELGKMLADYKTKFSSIFVPETQGLEVAGNEIQHELLKLGDDILANVYRTIAIVPKSLEQKSIVESAVTEFARALHALSDKVRQASDNVILSFTKFLQKDFSPRGIRHRLKSFRKSAMQKLRCLRSGIGCKRRKSSDMGNPDQQVVATT